MPAPKTFTLTATPSNPALIPAIRDAPSFSTIDAIANLKVPLACLAKTPSPKIEITSTPIKRGDALLSDPVEFAHHPLAPTDGSIQCTSTATLFDGRTLPAIEITPNSTAPIPSEPKTIHEDRLASLDSITPSALPEWIERFRAAGIHAQRRSSPDLLAQLNLARQSSIDVTICNLLDSDPSAALGSLLAANFPREIFAGVMLISRLVGASRTIFCADHASPGSWMTQLRSRARGKSVQWNPVANDYPQSDVTLLLYTLLHRRLKPSQLPVERGAVVLDAAAALAVGRLFLADEPMINVPLAVRDHARKRSHFVFAPIGMSAGEIVTKLGENHPDTMIRGGDLLRDVVLSPDAVVSGSELVLHTSPPEPGINPNACIRCGWCSEACPTRVQPAVVLEAAQLNDLDLAMRGGIDACIECGICSYVCPSKLPLLKGIRQMKAKHEI